MSGPDLADLWAKVLEWFWVAGRDERTVRLCPAAEPPLRDIAAYHCQHAMEKLMTGSWSDRTRISARRTTWMNRVGAYSPASRICYDPSARHPIVTTQPREPEPMITA